MVKKPDSRPRREVVLLRQLAQALIPPAEIAARLERPLDEVERKAASEDVPLFRPPLRHPARLPDL